MATEQTAFATIADLDRGRRRIRRTTIPTTSRTRLRAPREPLVILPQSLSELTGPGLRRTAPSAPPTPISRASTTASPSASAIVVSGRVLGSDGRPLGGQLVEIWQANAAGRYRHEDDTSRARSTRTSRAPGAASPTTPGGTAS